MVSIVQERLLVTQAEISLQRGKLRSLARTLMPTMMALLTNTKRRRWKLLTRRLSNLGIEGRLDRAVTHNEHLLMFFWYTSKMQFSAVRTATWMKDGLKARKDALKAKLPGGSPQKPEPAVQSEVTG